MPVAGSGGGSQTELTWWVVQLQEHDLEPLEGTVERMPRQFGRLPRWGCLRHGRLLGVDVERHEGRGGESKERSSILHG